MYDLFLTGSETTSTSLNWSILYLLHFPRLAEKLRGELDSAVGRERLPRIEDRDKVRVHVFRNSVCCGKCKAAMVSPVLYGFFTMRFSYLSMS